MLKLIPITMEQIKVLDGSSYGAMPDEDKAVMITESQEQLYEGAYYEVLVVYLDEEAIGFMSLCEQSAGKIGCAPEIKPEFRCRGYAFEAEATALKYAKEKGYVTAIAHVREDNVASQKLHEKLGFTLERKYVNKKNRMMLKYSKEL